MRFSSLAALGAVAAGITLLGSSLGGIASVDRQLAAAVPPVPAQSVSIGEPNVVPARFAADRVERPHRGPVRVLRLVDAQREVVIVLDGRRAGSRFVRDHGSTV